MTRFVKKRRKDESKNENSNNKELWPTINFPLPQKLGKERNAAATSMRNNKSLKGMEKDVISYS